MKPISSRRIGGFGPNWRSSGGVKDALVAVAGCRAVAAKAKELGAPIKRAEYAEGDRLSVAVMSIPDIFKWLAGN